jgi:RimJ/RimL family protein N-acetyltransferase
MVRLGPLPYGISSKLMTWRNDPAVQQWCRQWTWISEGEQRAWEDSLCWDKTVKMFGLYKDEDTDAVGVAGFTSIDPINHSAEFSLYIAPNRQGQDLGNQALRELLRHGFEDWNFHRIWGEVFDGNPALKLFEEAGFQVEGKLRDSYWRKGKWITSYAIAILRDEWVTT